MVWKVLFHEEFEIWLKGQEIDLPDEINFKIKLLHLKGPTLGRPNVDTAKGSIFLNMKELRIQYK